MLGPTLEKFAAVAHERKVAAAAAKAKVRKSIRGFVTSVH